MKKILSIIMLTLLLIAMLSLAFNIKEIGASITIYIRADGTVDPSGVPISSVDNITYVFTADIYGSIVVERDDIVVNGAGYSVEGPALESGISLSWRSNITIKNAEIKAFDNGIYFFRASNISIFGNNITNNKKGIYFSEDLGGRQDISGNTIIANDDGIYLEHCSAIISENNIRANNNNGIYSDSGWSEITGNNITNNNRGIQLWVGGANIIGNSIAANNNGIHAFEGYGTISGNNIIENGNGILLQFSSDISISKNNITNNGDGIILSESNSHNKIAENNITHNNNGVILNSHSDGNEIIGNDIANNSDNGIYLSGGMGFHPVGNIIFRNILKANNNSIYLEGVLFDNYITENNITNGDYGVQVQLSIWDPSGPTYIYHNNFLNNSIQAKVSDPFLVGGYPTWDDGYPSGGNYWSNYIGVDFYGGPNQDEAGSDGIVDEPYIIDDNNRDNYPLVNPWNITADWRSPFIMDIQRTPMMPNYDEDIVVSATITDDVAVDEALLSFTDDATWHNVSMNGIDDIFNGTIPAQPYGNLVQYKIHANDTSGNWAESNTYSYTVGDFVPPEVTLSQVPDYPQASQTVTVYANVKEPEDASGIKIVHLSYRVNNGSWWYTTMDFNAGLELYEKTIPIQQPSDTVEYFVEAQDYAGNLNLTETFSYVVTLGGDVDYDFDVDYDDFIAFAGRYGCDFGSPLYRPALDLNSDGDIDYDDFIILAGNYGENL